MSIFDKIEIWFMTLSVKRIVVIISVIAICLASLVSFSLCKKGDEHTVTFYYNKGIYFYSYGISDREERMSYSHQDTTVYEVVKFSGKYPPEPTPPENEGYVFLGWYQDPECTEKFLFGHYEVNSDINLYAKWHK